MAAPEKAQSLATPRILLAEDDSDTREMMKRILALGGWNVVAVPDGETALANWGDGAFDLVILDLGMPWMSGAEVARKIRASEAASHFKTPILALSAHVRKEERERCLQAGMNEFLPKPIRLTELYAAIARHLSARSGKS